MCDQGRILDCLQDLYTHDVSRLPRRELEYFPTMTAACSSEPWCVIFDISRRLLPALELSVWVGRVPARIDKYRPRFASAPLFSVAKCFFSSHRPSALFCSIIESDSLRPALTFFLPLPSARPPDCVLDCPPIFLNISVRTGSGPAHDGSPLTSEDASPNTNASSAPQSPQRRGRTRRGWVSGSPCAVP